MNAQQKKYDAPRMVSDASGLRVEWTPTPQEEITRQVANAIITDRDGKVRQALIDLGWTPPSGRAE